MKNSLLDILIGSCAIISFTAATAQAQPAHSSAPTPSSASTQSSQPAKSSAPTLSSQPAHSSAPTQSSTLTPSSDPAKSSHSTKSSIPAQPPAIHRPASRPPAIIFDTDMGPDYDDVGAIALLHAFADKGECRILATVASNRYPEVAGVLNVLNTYFGRPGIPIGVVRGPAVEMHAWQRWDSMLVADYPHTLRRNEDAADPIKLYRKLLAAEPDTSVTIVTVGFFTNMSNLLSSGPDKNSSLTGRQLVEKKVRRLVSMAGCFDKRMGNFKEFNVMKDAQASVVVFRTWPRPIILSGFEIGAELFTGLPIVHNEAIRHSPVKDVFARSIPMDPQDKNGRMSWDETAVLAAVRGASPWFDIVKGKIIAKADGSNGWDPAGTRDGYLVRHAPATDIEKVIDDLIMHQPAASLSIAWDMEENWVDGGWH